MLLGLGVLVQLERELPGPSFLPASGAALCLSHVPGSIVCVLRGTQRSLGRRGGEAPASCLGPVIYVSYLSPRSPEVATRLGDPQLGGRHN